MSLARNRYGSLLRGAALSALLVSQASAAEVAFNIPPEPLPAALQAFGLQSGAPIVFDPARARTIMSPGVIGALEPEVALSRLLVGTPFNYIRAGRGFTVLRPDALPSNLNLLGGIAGRWPARPI